MKEIQFSPGSHIDNAIIELKEKGYDCYGVFNGHKIYSNESKDDIYKKLTGYTCYDFYENIRKQDEEYENKKKSHKEEIPELIKEYCSKAIGIIPNDKIDLWNEIVPVRLNDLYEGMELACWLELISVLNNKDKTKEERFVECKSLFDNQGHSGMSANLVFSGLRSFHSDGDDLVNYIRK